MRVSVTTVEQYRRYLEDEDMSFEEIVRRLTTFEETPKMRAGTAWHAILENCLVDDLGEAEYDGIRFQVDVDADLYLPAIQEMRVTKEFVIDGEDVTLSGRVDAVDSGCVWDHKLTESADVENYLDSFQWRAYLAMTGILWFQYNLFIASPIKDDMANWKIRDLVQCRFTRYPGIEDEVESLLRDYVRFYRQHHIEDILSNSEAKA